MTSCLHITILLCLVVVVERLPYGEPTCTDVGGKPQFSNGIECVPCPTCGQGYGLSEICGNGQGVNAVCRVCPQGHFSDDDSSDMCRSCRICSNTMEDAVNCTSTSDRKCGQCSCGYFRHQGDGQCARCEDENSERYDECLLPCPTPTPSIQEPVNIVTTEEPTKRPTSLGPVLIIVIVLLGWVIIVVVCLYVCSLKKRPQKSCSSLHISTERAGNSVRDLYYDEQTSIYGCIGEGAWQTNHGSTNPPTEATCDYVKPDERQIECQKDDKDSLQKALPYMDNSCEGSHEGSANGSGILNSPEDPTRNPDSHVDLSSQGSRHSSTQAKYFLKSFELMLEQAKARGIDVVGQTFKIDNFAAAILDCHGGCLSIEDLDVHLYVPPGAIPIEKQQQVYIFVTGTSSVDEHSFSPFVHCGPPDAVFDKDVVLTMPHCMKDTTSCKFSLTKLSSGGSCELREGLDVITVVDNDSITFSVNHFCGFKPNVSPVDGTILKKSMIACVFLRDAGDVVELRLRLVDDVKVNVEKVKKMEREYGFYSADVESPLIVRKNDRAVVAKISNCIKTWEIFEPESCQRKFNSDMIWRETTAGCAQAFPSGLYCAKRRTSSEKICFKANVQVYQEGSESCDHGVTFLVDAKQGPILPPADLPDLGTQMKRILQAFMDQMLKFLVQSARIRSSPREEFKIFFIKLYDLLDVPNPLGNDWRKLLNLLFETDSGGCSVSIDSISDKAGREQRSPTEIVLDLFYGRQSGRPDEETMDTLKRALFAMNRTDVEELAHSFARPQRLALKTKALGWANVSLT